MALNKEMTKQKQNKIKLGGDISLLCYHPPVISSGYHHTERAARAPTAASTRGRQWRVPAHGAGSMDPQPSIHTAKMKEMPTIRHHPHHLPFLVITQANRTHGISTAQIPRSRKHELGIGVDDRLIKPRNAPRVVVTVPSHPLLAVLRYEDNAREDDAVRTGSGPTGRGRGGGGPGAGAGAAADVGGEEDGGEEDEEAEGDGDGVAEAEVAEAAEEPGGGGGGAAAGAAVGCGGGGGGVGGGGGGGEGGHGGRGRGVFEGRVVMIFGGVFLGVLVGGFSQLQHLIQGRGGWSELG
ncbi:hypothetical protein Scep_006125 [Stephania cephalantha]|uniref:Uncharacterized protein n=1 Tax=Stephania cephalantha TaxID=152367 RepID=A0AAP0PJT0_9MAGN